MKAHADGESIQLGFPRTRGDVPVLTRSGNERFVSPAHAGMYRFGNKLEHVRRAHVSPAHAGMYRTAAP